MAIITIPFEAKAGTPPSTNFPGLARTQGTNFPIFTYDFDASTEQAIFFKFRAVGYVSGNLTVEIDWHAATATSGVVRWGAQIACRTPDSDSGNSESKAFGTVATVDDTQLGTNAKRLQRCAITVTSLDSLAADDIVDLRISRVAANGADTMAGLAQLEFVTVSYTV